MNNEANFEINFVISFCFELQINDCNRFKRTVPACFHVSATFFLLPVGCFYLFYRYYISNITFHFSDYTAI